MRLRVQVLLFLLLLCAGGFASLAAAEEAIAPQESPAAVQAAPEPPAEAPAEVGVPAEEEPAVSEAPSALRIDRAVICTGVQDHEPRDPGTLFSGTRERLYCFTQVSGAQGETVIHHVWYWQDRKMADVPLVVRSPRFRTYSSKTLLPEWTGAWRVEVTGPEGELLETAAFNVE